VTSPATSVRQTREPLDSSCEIVSATGCPNLLPCPTLTIAVPGRSTARHSTETASALPWWPTFSASMPPTARAATSGSSTTDSASPVRRMSLSPAAARMTTLDSFAEGSSTASSGHRTDSETSPAFSAPPAVNSRIGAPTAEMSPDTSAAAPLATRICPTGMVDPSAPTPPVWSSCRCVSTTALRRRTPCRARASPSVPGSGPVSISTASAPSLTSTASPWPTSMTTTDGPAGGAGPAAITIVATTRLTAAIRAHTRDGRGHTTHAASAAKPRAAATTRADQPSGTAAQGIRASRPATSTAAAPHAAEMPRATSPTHGKNGCAMTPARPASRTHETSGPASRFAPGATRDATPKVPTMSGAVAACAVSVSAKGPASTPRRDGSATVTHDSASRANRTRPPTAATES